MTIFSMKNADNIDQRLEKFWGKPLSKRDLQICEAIGFAECEQREHTTIWCLTSGLCPMRMQIHFDGHLAKTTTDRTVETWIQTRQCGNLNEFFADDGCDDPLQRLLELALLVNLGFAKVSVAGKTQRVSATRKLRKLVKKYEEFKNDEVSYAVEEGFFISELTGDDLTYEITPKGFLSGKVDLGMFPFAPGVFRELVGRGFLTGSEQTGWSVTVAGEKAGLTSRTEGISNVFDRLGIGEPLN